MEKRENKLVDIQLVESETMTMMYIPRTISTDPTDGSLIPTEQYKILLNNKIGSDSYTNRGVQTLNLAQKTRDVAPENKIFMPKDVKIQVNNYEIENENRKEQEDEGTIMVREYEKSIEDIVNDKLSEPRALIDSEELASHISIYSQATTQSEKGDAKGGSKSGTSKNNPSKKVTSSNKEGEGNTSQNNLKESDTKSGLSDKLSSSSNTQQVAGQSKASGLPDSTIPAKMEFADGESLFNSTSILKAINIIERLLTQTKYHEQNVLYTDYPVVKITKNSDKKQDGKDENKTNINKFDIAAMVGEEAQPEEEESEDEEELARNDPEAIRLKPLFKFQCEITDNRNITCMDFNKANPDLLAVAYGEYDMNYKNSQDRKNGIVAFWTLKKPNFPEKLIKTEYSITALQFSKATPNLLALGDSMGGIMIYDVQSEDDGPIADSREIDEKHTDIVWEVKWVEKPSKGESLVSISGDGRVIEWYLKKGLEFNELMQLKRQANSTQKEANVMPAGIDLEKKTGMTFINTGGLSIDFPKGDSTTYFASTEDCTVVRCSVSYSERSLDTYAGHTGPVYKVRCNPFWSFDCQIFLTCSYDWTVRVYNHKEQIGKQEKLCCHEQYLQHQVNDVAWSPNTSSVFASVADDGRIEIWDLFKNNLEPKLIWFDKINKKTLSNTPKT